MCMIQTSFPRLKDRFVYEERGEQRIYLKMLVLIYNMRARMVGINQIRNTFLTVILIVIPTVNHVNVVDVTIIILRTTFGPISSCYNLVKKSLGSFNVKRTLSVTSGHFFCEQALETCALAILRPAPLWDNEPNAPAKFAPNLDFQWG